MTRVSAVVNAHRERRLLVPTLRSIRRARSFARQHGIEVETILVLDDVDDVTRSIAQGNRTDFDSIHEVEFRDLGRSREYGIARASNEHVFLHDGDDLFSTNWYHDFAIGLAEGRFDPLRVYHTELFVGFGEQRYFRLMLDSDSSLFDPLLLVAEWYFSNKCVIPKSLLQQCPLPYNDLRCGIGNEDWSWSSDTIAAGVRHSIVPKTICFYRHKPLVESLGLTPGVICHRSPLFDPEVVAVQAGRHDSLAEGTVPINRRVARHVTDLSLEISPPQWVWREISIQAQFDPLLTELTALPSEAKRLRLPRLSSNVAHAYRNMMTRLRNRPTVLLFFTEANIRGADYFIEKVIEAARATFSEPVQIVAVVEESVLRFEESYFWERYQTKIVSVKTLRERDRLEDWYFNRFLMRLFMQFDSVQIVDFCSDVFHRLFDQFVRPICARHQNIRFVYPGAIADLGSRAYANLKINVGAFRNLTGTAPPVLSLCRLEAVGAAAFADVVYHPAMCDRWRHFLERRFARDSTVRIELLQRVDFSPVFAAPHPRSQSVYAVQSACSGTQEEGFRAIVTEQCYFAPQIVDQARDMLKSRPRVEALVPQIVIVREAGGIQTALWIDRNDVRNHLAGLVARSLADGCDLPFFAFVRLGCPVGDVFRRTIPKSPPPSAVELIGALLQGVRRGSLIPLPNSVCFSTFMKSLPEGALDRTLNDH